MTRAKRARLSGARDRVVRLSPVRAKCRRLALSGARPDRTHRGPEKPLPGGAESARRGLDRCPDAGGQEQGPSVRRAGAGGPTGRAPASTLPSSRPSPRTTLARPSIPRARTDALWNNLTASRWLFDVSQVARDVNKQMREAVANHDKVSQHDIWRESHLRLQAVDDQYLRAPARTMHTSWPRDFIRRKR